MNDKFIHKYMRLAKQVGEDGNPCYSRKIGSVIVHSRENRILGTGFNGPPRKTPHCDERDYLEMVVWPQLTEEEKNKSCGYVPTKEEFLDRFTSCRTCPRRIIGAKSGERREICGCAHSECNAIVNASQSLYDSYMFCWCGVPCADCSKLIVNSGIKKVFCLDRYPGQPSSLNNEYDLVGRHLLRWGNVELIELNPDEILGGDNK